MHYLKSLLAALVFAVAFTSCSPSLSPFTDNIYDEFGSSERELSKIQFYLSNDIKLYRDFGGKQSSIENGKIKIIDGRKVEEIVFKKGTPGVFVFSPRKDRIAVSFEEGDGKYLMFGPNDKVGGRFVLLAKEWKRNRGKVSYANEVWNTTDASAYSSLLVDLDKARKTQVRKKTASGRRVQG